MAGGDEPTLLPPLDGRMGPADGAGHGPDAAEFVDDGCRGAHGEERTSIAYVRQQPYYVFSLQHAYRVIGHDGLMVAKPIDPKTVSPAATALKQMRKRAGLSVREAAKLSGLSSGSSYQHWEDVTKSQFFKMDLVEKLAPMLIERGIPREEVYALAGVEPSTPGFPNKFDSARKFLSDLMIDRAVDATALSEALGQEPGYLEDYVIRGSPRMLPDKIREQLAERFEFDAESLDPGSYPAAAREPGKAEQVADLPAAYSGDLQPGTIEVGGTDFTAIGQYDAAFSAGQGSLLDPHEEPLGYHLVQAQWLHTVTHSSPDHLAVVRVDGDSMESTLHDGDWVLIDRKQTKALRAGIYAINAHGHCWIKRLNVSLSKKLIQIISDNKAYEIDELPEEEVTLIGRVISLVIRKIP